MQYSYYRFIDQLKTIESLAKDHSQKIGLGSDNNFSSLLNVIITFKRAKFKYSLGLENLEELKNATEAERESINKLGQTIEEMDILIKNKISDKPILKKAYSKIEFKVSENDNNRISLVTETDSVGLLKYIFKNDDVRNEYKESLDKQQLVLESLIVSLCTYLETFISSIMKDFYLNTHQGDLFSKNKISFKDLKDMDSVEGARVFLIESELDILFRKNFNDWFREIDNLVDIKKNFKNNDLVFIIKEISELYLRRNLYVHADGKVSDYYLNSAPVEYKKGLEIGEKLKVDENYIQQKIYVIEKLGTMVLYSYSLKKYNDSEDIFDLINDIFLDQIKDSSNDIYSIIYSKLSDLFEHNSSTHVISKINYFLSYKLRGKYDLIEKEISAYNVSAYDIRYKRAIAIIMENENCINLVLENFKSQSDDEFLFEIQWPLYDIIREDIKFKLYVEERLSKIFS